MRFCSRLPSALLLLLLFNSLAGGAEDEFVGDEPDEWHAAQRFSPTSEPLSIYHKQAMNSAAHLLALGKSHDALAVCNKVLRSDPLHAPGLTMKAKVLAAQGRAAAARISAQKAIDADPGWVGAYEVLASLYADQGQRHMLLRNSEAAYESFRKILLLDLASEVLPSTTLASAYYGMGRALLTAGIETEAIKNLESAISISPRSVEMQHKLARTLVERGERFGGDGALLSAQEQDKSLTVLRRALEVQHNHYLWVHLVAANQRAFEWYGRMDG